MKALMLAIILGGVLYGVYMLNSDMAGLSGGGQQEYQLGASKAAGQAIDGLRQHEATNKTQMDKALEGR